jgi:hypothetical protein
MEVITTRDTLGESIRRRDALQSALDELGRAYASATGALPFEALRAADGITVASGDGPNILRVRLRALPFNAGAEWVITDAYGEEGAIAQVFVRAALASRRR